MGAGVGCWGLGFSSLPHPPAPYPRLEELRSRGARGVDAGAVHLAVILCASQRFTSAWAGLDAGEFYRREARALTRPTALAFCVSQFFMGQRKKPELKHLLTLAPCGTRRAAEQRGPCRRQGVRGRPDQTQEHLTPPNISAIGVTALHKKSGAATPRRSTSNPLPLSYPPSTRATFGARAASNRASTGPMIAVSST